MPNKAYKYYNLYCQHVCSYNFKNAEDNLEIVITQIVDSIPTHFNGYSNVCRVHHLTNFIVDLSKHRKSKMVADKPQVVTQPVK